MRNGVGVEGIVGPAPANAMVEVLRVAPMHPHQPLYRVSAALPTPPPSTSYTSTS